jgi:transposase
MIVDTRRRVYGKFKRYFATAASKMHPFL